ncbi:MAG: hypothetical protein ACRC1F_01460 [Metamycoplasmataceae bacterium]
MSKFLRSREKQMISSADHQMNGVRPMNGPQMGPRPMNGPQMNGPQMGPRPMNGPQMNGPQMNGPQMNGPQMNGPQMNGPQMGPRPIQPFNNQIPVMNNQIGTPLVNGNFRTMNMNIPNSINGPRPIINPNQMNTGMINMNNTGMLNQNNTALLALNKLNNFNSTSIIKPNESNFNPMTTGMLNLSTGEFIPTPQMSTGMLNLNTGEFIPTPQNTGMLNLSTGEFIPSQQNTGMLNMNTGLINQNLPQRNNPFFDPSMNTFEFDFNRNTSLLNHTNPNKNQVESKLEELQKMYNSRLISDDEYLSKKRDLIKKALDNL